MTKLKILINLFSLKIILNCSTLFFGFTCYSQSENKYIIKSDSLQYVCWKSNDASQQKLYWPNGTIKLEYYQLHDSIFLRKEYDENKMLKCELEIFQVYRKITSMKIENGKMTTVKDSGYIDIFHGMFKLYSVYSEKVPVVIGSYLHNKQNGEWYFRNPSENLISVNFNNSGELDGVYKEYHSKNIYDRSKIKWEGYIKTVHNKVTLTKDSPYYDINKIIKTQPTTKSIVRFGKWKHFDENGNLLETIKYK